MNELKKIAPELSKIEKEQVFNVPDKYFDDFYSRMQYRLETEMQPLPSKVNPVIRFFKPVLGLAASFALVFMLVYFPIKLYIPDYFAKDRPSAIQNEDDDFRNLLEYMDENSFFALINEPVAIQQTNYQNFNDEELLNYISSNVSEYEIYLQTEN